MVSSSILRLQVLISYSLTQSLDSWIRSATIFERSLGPEGALVSWWILLVISESNKILCVKKNLARFETKRVQCVSYNYTTKTGELHPVSKM